jgi:hypothetical protein
VGLTTLPCKKKIVEKPPKNSAGFCGGGQSLSWAVEPRKEDRLKVVTVNTALSYNEGCKYRSPNSLHLNSAILTVILRGVASRPSN